ncbi:MAG: PQQ-dependent sugar dehydrogenase [Planctomycetes bacterium]|nr:PQQ-dependent sugar dehydrogenase [Planctomycetota bacterium]
MRIIPWVNRFVVSGLLAMLVGLTMGVGVAADQPMPFDTAKRVLWSGSKVQGAPEPPARYRTVRTHAGVKLESPVDAQLSPDRKRWYITEQMAVIRTFPADGSATASSVLLNLATPDRNWDHRRNAYSVAFHPRFAENGFLYLFTRDPIPDPATARITRYVVTTAADGTPTCDPASAVTIIAWPSGEDHFGGSLNFGNDGMLYFPVGDGNGYGDAKLSGQDLSDLNASVMRIDVDRPAPGQQYAIPADNPFLTIPKARGEVWAYGLRNVWKMSFDRVTGDLWGCDVGQDLWDSVMRIERGQNYGWSVFEGSHDFRPERAKGPTPIAKPLYEHEHFEARSLTGGFVYRGKTLKELTGAYVYGDYDTGKIWGIRAEGARMTWHQELVDTPLRIVGFAQDGDGELIMVDHTGSLHRLEAQDPAVIAAAAAMTFPRKLSETGIFADTARNVVAPGVLPYSVNSPLWSDDAHKERFIAIPGDGKIQHDKSSGWEFPEGTVLVKTFALDLVTGDPTSRRRLETRIEHLEQHHWRNYTYLWNDAQTDAELLDDPKGRDRTFTIRETDGKMREQLWHFPGRAECTLCHTMPMNYVLGPTTRQMNRDHDYGDGVIANQIEVLDRLGMLSKPLKGGKATDLAKLADPKDERATLEERARAYLHANCAHCHTKWGGGNAYFWLTSDLPLDKTATLGTAPQHGDLHVAGAKVIDPGHPERSLIALRMAMLGPERMPRIASSVIDQDAVKLISEWIKSLPKP